MYARGDKLLLYVTYVEAGGGGRCEVWAQTDSVEYGRLERCIAALGPDTCGQAPPGGYAGVEVCDVLLARYDSDGQWYRVVVLDKPGMDLVRVQVSLPASASTFLCFMIVIPVYMIDPLFGRRVF